MSFAAEMLGKTIFVVALSCLVSSVAADFNATLTLRQIGSLEITFFKEWAPIGVEHVKKLLEVAFFDNSAIFRVVPNFVIQFGINGTPSDNRKWTRPIKDDPVKASNMAGTITFATAGPDTRTTQLFINLADNSFLDAQGFAPVGKIVSNFEALSRVVNPTPDNSNGIDQDAYAARGNAYIERFYPNATFIATFTKK